MSFPYFCIYFSFKYTPLVNSTMVYEKGLFTSFWHREVSGKVFLRALYIKFSHFPIRCIANMSFSHFVYISVSNIYPLVNSKMVYEKGLFKSLWHREVSGKVFLRALYIKFSHFPIRCIANMSFSYFCVYFRFKYSLLVN